MTPRDELEAHLINELEKLPEPESVAVAPQVDWIWAAGKDCAAWAEMDNVALVDAEIYFAQIIRKHYRPEPSPSVGWGATLNDGTLDWVPRWEAEAKLRSAPSVGAQELAARELLEAFDKLDRTVQTTPIARFEARQAVRSAAEKLRAALATTQPQVSFVQPPIEGNPPCHICGGKMEWKCSKCGASSLPTEAVCPKCGKGDNFLIVAGRRVCMNHEGKEVPTDPKTSTTTQRGSAKGAVSKTAEAAPISAEELAGLRERLRIYGDALGKVVNVEMFDHEPKWIIEWLQRVAGEAICHADRIADQIALSKGAALSDSGDGAASEKEMFTRCPCPAEIDTYGEIHKHHEAWCKYGGPPAEELARRIAEQLAADNVLWGGEFSIGKAEAIILASLSAETGRKEKS